MKLSDFNLLDDDSEKNELLTLVQSFNQTDHEFSDATLHQLFSQQAAKTPNAAALISDGITLSYSELEQRSNQLARLLIAKGVAVEQTVAVMLEPSAAWLIAVIAVLKAGGCYLPIDSRTPNARIAFMLSNTQTQYLITDSSEVTLEYKPSRFDKLRTGFVLQLMDADEYSNSPLEQYGKPENLAYIIYTSGSSGQPKGVMIEHRSAVNMINWHQRYYQASSDSRVTLFASIGFDASIWETLPYLLAGACLYPLNENLRLDTERLIEFIQQHAITHVFVPPLVCQEISRTHSGRLNKTLTILTGGDTLKTIAADDLHIVNNYGPTECTVLATAAPVLAGVTPVIGTPIDNTQIYITDSHRQLVPVGVSGEICIAGVGLARGYWDDAALTAQKFIANPFEPLMLRPFDKLTAQHERFKQQRLYCSGDLGRWRTDGVLEFLGRIDDQIKIRGFRIEPSEIENTLLKQPSVKAAVVIARELSASNPVLLAYIVLSESVDNDILREHLKKQLPEFMLPAQIIVLPELPVTANGKIDKNALPAPTAIISTSEFTATANETEQVLQTIWQEVLEKSPISVTDDFFELGGHSIKLTGIVARIRTHLQFELPFAVLFKLPTIRQLADFILDAAKFDIKDADEPMLLLNGVTNSRKVFAFPPVTGDAIGFSQLASYFKDCSFYSFNFLEADTRITDYADLIIATDPIGPYQLLGYSAGGNLAYHVAYQLEQRGKQVTDIVMIDSAQLKEPLNYPPEEIQNTIEQYIQHDSMQPYLHNSVLRDKAARLIRRYHEYLSKTLDDKTVNAAIHLLISEDSQAVYYSDDAEIVPLLVNSNGEKREVLTADGWQNVTRKTFKKYQGMGDHNQLLLEPYLKNNADIILAALGIQTDE